MRIEFNLRDEETSPISFTEKFRYHLNLDFKAEKLANHILTQASEMDLIGHRLPNTAAAVAIYISSHLTGKGKTLAQIEENCNVTIGTLENIYKSLYSEIESLLPVNHTFDLSLLPNCRKIIKRK